MRGIFKGDSYSGSQSYRHVERLLKGGKRLMIVSPYVDEHYANFLLGLSRRRKIYLICSSINKSAHRTLTRGRIPRFAFGMPVILFLSAYLASFISQALFTLIVAALLLSALLLGALIARRKPANISIKIPRRFVHAKIYLSEKGAIQGSANLTYRSLHSNIEHIEMLYDREEIRELEKQFWSLWGSY